MIVEAYITKYCNTDGVTKIKGQVSSTYPDTFYSDGVCFFKPDWHLTKEEAKKEFERKKVKE